jgi:nicotinamide riboside kinase
MFVNAVGIEITNYHGLNPLIICKDTDDTITQISKYLESGKYEPHIYNRSECAGCAAKLWDQIKDLSGSLRDIARYVVDDKASPQEYERRRQICQSCQQVNTEGERMFRQVTGGYYSCGVLRFDNILRDSKRDGCGCILNIKWAGQTQKCPHSQW